MKNTKELIEIMQAYCDGAVIEYKQHMSSYWCVATTPTWAWDNIDFRVKDPYAELKVAAQDPTKQIRCLRDEMPMWSSDAFGWDFIEKFPYRKPSDYEIRDKPKAMKQIKLQAWYDGGRLFWQSDEYKVSRSCKRVPAEDKTIEVEEV